MGSRTSDSEVRKIRGADAAFESFERAPVACVQLWVRAGASLEVSEVSGAAHFLEHLLFQGRYSRFAGRGLGDIIERAGGAVNAWTSQDYTVIHATFPAESFGEVASGLVHGVLNPELSREVIDRERGVILQEIARERENPGLTCTRTLFDERYSGHPYGRRVLGSRETVSRLTRKALQAFHRQYYHPSNMAVAVVGQLDRDQVFLCLEEELSCYRGKGASVRKPEVPRARNGRAVTRMVSRDSAEAFFAVGFPIPHLFHGSVPALDCFSGIFGETESSVLEAWRRSEGLVNSVGSISYTPIHGGTFVVSGSTHPDKLVSSVKGLREVLADTLASPVPEAALAAVKQDLLASTYRMDETAQGRAGRLGHEMATAGRPGFLKKYMARVLALTAGEVSRTAAKYLLGRRGTLILTGPEEALPSEPEIFSASTVRVVAEPEDRPIRTSTGSGPVILHWRERSHPTVAIRIQGPGGLEMETESNNGIHALLSRMWLCGCGGRSGRSIMRDFDSLGARFGGNSGFSRAAAWLDVPVGTLMPAVELMGECLSRPNLDRGDMDRERALLLEAVRTRVDRPQELLGREMVARLFRGHPYGLDPLGAVESLSCLGRKELRQASRRVFHRDSLIIGIVGDCDAEEVAGSLVSRVASRSRTEPPPRSTTFNAGDSTEISGPFRQSHVGLVWPAEDSSSSLLLEVKALGNALAMMSGPLFHVLRDELGVAYSFGAGAVALRLGGWLQVRAAVRPGTENQSIDAVRSVIARITAGGPESEALLERGRDHLAGMEVLAFQRKAAIAAWMCANEETVLGYDSFRNLSDRIRKIEPAALIDTARSIFEVEPVVVILKPEQVDGSS